MQYILALRSYGDFVILLNHLVNSESKKSTKVLASLHLKPLYDALNETIGHVKSNLLPEYNFDEYQRDDSQMED